MIKVFGGRSQQKQFSSHRFGRAIKLTSRNLLTTEHIVSLKKWSIYLEEHLLNVVDELLLADLTNKAEGFLNTNIDEWHTGRRGLQTGKSGCWQRLLHIGLGCSLLSHHVGSFCLKMVLSIINSGKHKFSVLLTSFVCGAG
jgi:hypothetical protein